VPSGSRSLDVLGLYPPGFGRVVDTALKISPVAQLGGRSAQRAVAEQPTSQARAGQGAGVRQELPRVRDQWVLGWRVLGWRAPTIGILLAEITWQGPEEAENLDDLVRRRSGPVKEKGLLDVHKVRRGNT
jgi:hypothetical protein